MKNPQELIGKKVKGFKFEDFYYCPSTMDEFVGKIGTVELILQDNNRVLVDFGNSDSWIYPADQIEAHLVEDEETIKEEIKQELLKKKVLICNSDIEIQDEIPTLSGGVMMLVSDDEIHWQKHNVIGQKYNYFYAWVDKMIVYFEFCKPLEPTKEEQLTAILGSSEKVSEIMELFKN